MSLWNGLDTVSWVSLGLYSETYGSTDQANLNILFASLGLLEEEVVNPDLLAGRIRSIRNQGPHSKFGMSNTVGRQTRAVTGKFVP